MSLLRGMLRPFGLRPSAGGAVLLRPSVLLRSMLCLCVAGCCRSQSVEQVNPAIALQGSGGVALQGVNFPVTAFGAQLNQPVEIASISSVDLHVTGLSVSGPAAALFTVTPSPSAAKPLTVPAGSAVAMMITFAPTLPSPIPAGDVQEVASLTVESDDPAHPQGVRLPLTGKAAAPAIDLCWAQTPTTELCVSKGAVTVQLGTVAPKGSSPPQEIDLLDTSDVPLTLTSVALDAAAQAAGFAIVESLATPLTLSAAGGESVALHVVLTPKSAGPLTGHLVVQSDDPRFAALPPPSLTLAGAGQPDLPPTACLGIFQIDYADGQSVSVDPTLALSAQPGVTPPGPLDALELTAEPTPQCSFDAEDGQALAYQFTLAGPTGSTAALLPVSGHPEERTILFDVAGQYAIQLQATDSAGLSANAQLTLPVQPHDDLSAALGWQGPVPVDLDLHLVRVEPDAGTDPTTLVGDPLNDCFYCNCLPPKDYGTLGSPCGASYPTAVDWGLPDKGVRDLDDPLLASQVGDAPLNSEPLDTVDLSGPEPGADYDLFALYYQPSQGDPGQDAGCRSSADCTNPGFPSCVQPECTPAVQATLHLYVEGQELTDAGSPLAATLAQPCALWHAGTIHWISGGHLVADGGFAPPRYTFTPAPDGGLSARGTPGAALACEPP